MTRATWWTIIGLTGATLLLWLCAGCRAEGWRPAPMMPPAMALRLRQLAVSVADAHPDDAGAAAVSRALGVPGEPATDTPVLADQVNRDTDAYRAMLEVHAAGPGARPVPVPDPAPGPVRRAVRWLTWRVGIALAAGALVLVALGTKGALKVRKALRRGKGAWDALVSVAGNADRAKDKLPADQAKAMVSELAKVPDDVADTVRAARKAAGTYRAASQAPPPAPGDRA